MSKKVLIFPQCVPTSKEGTWYTYRKQFQVETAQPKETWLRAESVKANSCKSDGIKVELICKHFWKFLQHENLSSWQVQQLLYPLQKIFKASFWVSFDCLFGVGLFFVAFKYIFQPFKAHKFVFDFTRTLYKLKSKEIKVHIYIFKYL